VPLTEEEVVELFGLGKRRIQIGWNFFCPNCDELIMKMLIVHGEDKILTINYELICPNCKSRKTFEYRA